MATPAVRLRVGAGLATVALAFAASACGSEASEFSDTAQRGKITANANGCASCHGAQGQGGVGPTWVGLAGAERELADGTTVVADDAYLLRSILEPSVEEVIGYNLKMPTNGLSDAQAADIVAYIKELVPDAP
ncbi:MAG: cytochrome c family protein [Ilumatobacter sp.]